MGSVIKPPGWWLTAKRRRTKRAINRQQAAIELDLRRKAAETERYKSMTTELRKKPQPDGAA